ncbi:MAG: malonate--CoA ligase [Rhizobiaceae bacterium]
MNGNIFQHFVDAAGDGLARLIETRDGAHYSYADMFALSGQIANALVAAGVKPGDRVAAQVEKSVMAMALYLGVVRCGGVFNPLNTAYTDTEIAYFIGDAKPTVLVCDPKRAAGLVDIAKANGAAILTLDAEGEGSLTDSANHQPEAFSTVHRQPDDLAAILYTSGTTGRSKGAMLTHNNLLSNAKSLVSAWRFTASDILIHALPTYHTHGLFVATNTVMLSGASMIYLPKFDADQVLQLLPRATTLMGVPTFYTRLLDHPKLDRSIVANIRLFVSGSAPLLAETHREWSARTGTAILERYGMTETNMNTSNPYDGERVAGTVGFALPDVDVRIANPDTGALVPQGEIGVIEVKGPNVFKGYWQMPEKTAEEFRADAFFITGDLGKIDSQGYVHIVGRAKDLVITGGFNVYPKELEDELDALEGVLESAVIGLPHKDFGEAVTAVIVKTKSSTITEADVLSAIEPRFAKFKHPKRILFVDDLPRNAMGKVQKNLLRAQFAALYS